MISLSDPQNNMSDLKCLKKILLLLVRKSKVFKFLCEEEVEEEVKTLVFNLPLVPKGLKSQLGEDADQILGDVSSWV